MKTNNLNQEVRLEMFYELEKAKSDLDTSIENFNSASSELVDYYSYRIKAAEAKYDYLLKRSKDMNLTKFN